MAQILYSIIVVLNYRKTVAGLIAFAQLVVQKMTNNAYFPTATQLLTSTTNAITAYQAAVSSSATSKGLKGQRTSTKNALLSLLRQLRDLVRTVAETSPEIAITIVESAGMGVANRAGRVKALIAVVQAMVANSALSGSVVCHAKAPGIPTCYFWSYSLDQKVWTSVPMSQKAMVTVSGLTPGQTYYFRYYTQNRKGISDPTQIVSLLVK